MAEEHRVAHRAEERRTDDEPGGRERDRAARELGRREQSDERDDRRDEIERGRELGPDRRIRRRRHRRLRSGRRADHRGDARLALGAQRLATAHPRGAAHDGDPERDGAASAVTQRGGAGDCVIVGEEDRTARERERHRRCCAAASRSRGSTSRRRVVTQQNSRPPAASWRRNVPASSSTVVPAQATRARSRAASFRRTGPSAVATTMSSSRMPNRPGQVDAGLDAERVSGLDRHVVAGDHVRILVRVAADPVTDAVHEVVAEARGRDHVARGRVDGLARRPDASRPARRPPGRRRAPRTCRGPRSSVRRRGTCA